MIRTNKYTPTVAALRKEVADAIRAARRSRLRALATMRARTVVQRGACVLWHTKAGTWRPAVVGDMVQGPDALPWQLDAIGAPLARGETGKVWLSPRGDAAQCRADVQAFGLGWVWNAKEEV